MKKRLRQLVEIIRDPGATRRRISKLEKALGEMCDLAEEGSQYKGEHLREKHGNAEEIAKARALLPTR